MCFFSSVLPALRKKCTYKHFESNQMLWSVKFSAWDGRKQCANGSRAVHIWDSICCTILHDHDSCSSMEMGTSSPSPTPWRVVHTAKVVMSNQINQPQRCFFFIHTCLVWIDVVVVDGRFGLLDCNLHWLGLGLEKKLKWWASLLALDCTGLGCGIGLLALVEVASSTYFLPNLGLEIL
jgi:hypothetical protein